MKTFYKLCSMLLCSSFLLGGCTKETQTDGGDPRPGDDSIAEVREVMMTLKSQLVCKKAPPKQTPQTPRRPKQRHLSPQPPKTPSPHSTYTSSERSPRTVTTPSLNALPIEQTAMTNSLKMPKNCNRIPPEPTAKKRPLL